MTSNTIQETQPPLLALRGLSKTFGLVRALSDARSSRRPRTPLRSFWSNGAAVMKNERGPSR